MEQMPQLDKLELSTVDWEGTPIAVQQLVLALLAENQELKARLSVIEEQIKQNSQNSSKPPSKDGFGAKPKVKKAKGEKARGGQLGHPGHERNFQELTAESEIHEYIPSSCRVCGVELEGTDPQPYRHQVVEVPPIAAKITEHRLHQLECPHCGEKTRAKLPAGISAIGYGARLSALVAWLSSDYRQSHGQLQQLLKQLLGIEISIASINRLRQEMSLALESVVTQAHEYVQSQPQIHSDETSFSQGNCDGHNPQQQQGWLWVAVTKLMSIFEVSLNRGQVTAKQMIGEQYAGIVISDRYSSYNWLEVEQRQVCWAHLKRDLTAIAERSGVSQTIGAALLKRQQRLFRWWHRVRDGTMSRADFATAVVALRQGFKAELESAVQLPIGKNEKTPLAKTVRTCEQLLKIEPALWTFVTIPGVEPTNNAAEQALRQAVIWRRTSFGSQSLAGSQFVARLLSAVTSLKAQQRDVWDFLTLVCQAARFDLPMPSLIPLDCHFP
jgi:transposase